tara:strand:+ start:3671 stop:4372 length:702 start_codon:yes stop_codon:yes gene_type:complete
MWFDILKERVGSKVQQEMSALADKVPIPNMDKDFDFKKEYTYDELIPLLEFGSSVEYDLDKVLKEFMSEKYRYENMSESDRKALRRRGEMPKPFTLEEVKDKILFRLDGGDFDIKEENGKTIINVPTFKEDVDNLKTNALDELYAGKKQTANQPKKPKWYTDYRAEDVIDPDVYTERKKKTMAENFLGRLMAGLRKERRGFHTPSKNKLHPQYGRLRELEARNKKVHRREDLK